MKNEIQIERQNEIRKLSNELTYRRYLMNKGKMSDLFLKLSIPEYVALQNIAVESEKDSIYGGRTYLKDLADKMELSVRQTSNMIAGLKDRGLVHWSHDGNGSEGTYVTITEVGRQKLYEQEDILKDFYERVIEKYGKQNLIELLRLMKQLDTVMNGEMELLNNPDLNEKNEDYD